MNKLQEAVYQRLSRSLPAPLSGRIDLRIPSFWASWGGPLNGQAKRRAIVRDIARAARFTNVIETGTFRGTSTEFFVAVFGTPVETVEGDRRSYEFSRHRLTPLPEVTVVFGDSREFLRNRAQAERASEETLFVYLDAHWSDDLPLAAELNVIGSSWSNVVVMIDDFEVPGDPGYGYDDYGQGKRLTASYLPWDSLDGWQLFYPAAPSSTETGAKRGCCVLASPSMTPAIREVSGLLAASALHE